MILKFFYNTKAEILKCRNTAAIWVTIIGALFIPLVNLFKCVARPDYFIPKLKSDPWGVFLEYNWQIAAAFMLTMYVILVASFVVQIEFRNGTWKQVYISPRSYADIFFSKFLTIHLMIVGGFVLFNIFLLLCGYIIGLIQPEALFLNHSVPWSEMIITTLKMYASVFAMTVIQYWLSLRFRNFVFPMGVGLVLFTIGFMIRQWEHIAYYPYMYPFLVYFENPGLPAGTQQNAIASSLILSAVGLIAGFLNIRLMNEKG
jgi:lantibiotic transport system permease protein